MKRTLASRSRRTLIVATLASALASAAWAQAGYPDRPLKIVAPIAPGGLTDTVARMFAAGLSTRLGQQVVVDNRAGGGGVIGMTAAAKSPPDGYGMVLVYQGVASVNPVLIKDLPYDTLRDFAPVAQVASFPFALVVSNKLAVNDLRELLALARSKPGGLSYASAGNATTSHLTMELFKRRTELRMVHIPYKGEAPALNDLMGGQIDVAFSSLASVLPHIQSGRLRVLGVTSAERSPLAPQLPTIGEAGVPGFQSVGWYALLAPQGTPQFAVARLNKEVLAILAEPDFRARMMAQTLTPTGSTPEGLRTWIAEDMERWRKVIVEAGIKAD
jgi:tripartite-type tricarboxylate transporter receptor subunit TctC